MATYKMREIKKIEETRYPVPEISQAICLSENAVYNYFSNRGISCRGGLTLDQIVEVIMSPRRGSGINEELVHEIVRRLDEEKGITVIRDGAADPDKSDDPEQLRIC